MAATELKDGELVGEFLTSKAAVDAARQYIHEKQVRGRGVPWRPSDTPATPNGSALALDVKGASMQGVQERRRTPRFTVVEPVPARVHGTFSLRLIDLSLGGARIEHLGQLFPGFGCALEFLPPVGPLSLAGLVVRSSVVSNWWKARGDRHFRYESGLAFAEVTAEQETLLAAILEQVGLPG